MKIPTKTVKAFKTPTNMTKKLLKIQKKILKIFKKSNTKVKKYKKRK